MKKESNEFVMFIDYVPSRKINEICFKYKLPYGVRMRLTRNLVEESMHTNRIWNFIEDIMKIG